MVALFGEFAGVAKHDRKDAATCARYGWRDNTDRKCSSHQATFVMLSRAKMRMST